MNDIDELEGEELAAAVAEVRGWHLFTDIGGQQCWASGNEAGWHKSFYRPDRQISLVWELIENLRHDGWIVFVGAFQSFYDIELRKAENVNTTIWQRSAQTVEELPAAICHAFLKAQELRNV